jgi:3-oxoacyl-(acyl-carrier-protein) synthase
MKRNRMVRTQVQLTSRQTEALKKLSSEKGGSIAQWVRRGVDLLIRDAGIPDKDALKRRALAAVGAGSSGVCDIADKHDDYLDDAYDPKKP